MGLDIIELILEVETVFEIQIADWEAREILTVGELQAVIIARLPPTRNMTAFEVEDRLYRLIIDQFGVAPEKLHPNARFVDDLRLD